MFDQSRQAIFDAAEEAIPGSWYSFKPTLGVVLGSGWSRTVLERECVDSLNFSVVPGFGAAGVPGHAGEIRLIETAGHRAVVFCGRRHYYECRDWNTVVMPVELMRRLGVSNLLLTNAAGGIRDSLHAGDILLITDHINTTGSNPLQGPVVPGWGARFPDQTHVYSEEQAGIIRKLAKELSIQLQEGVYAFTSGPCFETPAEIRAYRAWGADAVGMSTVPEAIVANAAGMRVSALSLITNMAAGISRNPLTHGEVMEATEAAAPRMEMLLTAILSEF